MTKTNATLCVKRNDVPPHWLQETFYAAIADLRVDEMFYDKTLWIERSEAEFNTEYKQIIPYIIARLPDERIACYQRKGSEKRLNGLWSVGVGGHIDLQDAQVTFSDGVSEEKASISQIAMQCVLRELGEEFLNPLICNVTYMGIVNEERTKVGKVHTAMVFIADLQAEAKAATELYQLHWIKPEQIKQYKCELWSELALQLYQQINT